jgi:hypothetical protein
MQLRYGLLAELVLSHADRTPCLFAPDRSLFVPAPTF